MHHTTGFTKAKLAGLRDRIAANGLMPGMRPWPPILGLWDSLTATLKYLRRNRTQAEIAEDYGVSRSTISRAIAAMTPLIVGALIEFVPTRLLARRQAVRHRRHSVSVLVVAFP
jgi:hypothetical protein